MPLLTEAIVDQSFTQRQQIMLRQFILASIIATSHVCWAEAQSVYTERFQCVGGPFGLRLPSNLHELLKIGSIRREVLQGIEQWDGYTATRKYLEFDGFTLGIITFSNDLNRYMVSYAEITSPRWSRIAPFRVKESINSVRQKFGNLADNDSGLASKYGSESGDINFESSHRTIEKITYSCYVG
jgi:hypothetical protein